MARRKQKAAAGENKRGVAAARRQARVAANKRRLAGWLFRRNNVASENNIQLSNVMMKSWLAWRNTAIKLSSLQLFSAQASTNRNTNGAREAACGESGVSAAGGASLQYGSQRPVWPWRGYGSIFFSQLGWLISISINMTRDILNI